MISRNYKLVFVVSGMRCSNCALRVKKALEERFDVCKIDISLSNGKVEMITNDKIDECSVIEIIQELGYEFAGFVCDI